MSCRRHPAFKTYFFWRSHQINKHKNWLIQSLQFFFAPSLDRKIKSKVYLDVGVWFNSLPLSVILLSSSHRTANDFVILDNPSSGLLMLQLNLPFIVLLLFVSMTDSIDPEIPDEIPQFSSLILDKLPIINFSTVNWLLYLIVNYFRINSLIFSAAETCLIPFHPFPYASDQNRTAQINQLFPLSPHTAQEIPSDIWIEAQKIYLSTERVFKIVHEATKLPIEIIFSWILRLPASIKYFSGTFK